MSDDNENLVSPWPGEVDTEGLLLEADSDNPLNAEQDARASALYHARSVLEAIGPSGIGRPSGERTPPTRMDLLSVATWIMTGTHRVD